MQLQKLFLENYRGIDTITLDLEGKSTVLFGVNGVGKSSVLRGVNLIFAHIINRIVKNQFKQQISITRDDVRFGTNAARLYGLFVFDNGQEARYGFSYSKSTNTRKVMAKELSEFINLFNYSYLTDEAASSMMPVFAFYGINRAVFDVPLRIKKTHEFGRVEAFQNAIESKTDFRTFFEWFRNQEDIENEQKKEKNDLSYVDPALNAVRRSIYKMLPELSNLRISRKPLRMCATKGNQTLTIEQLSDGEKCVLAMLGDLARRLALANPTADDPLMGTGIVLIDEIELHMHPSWQRRIIPLLHETFPNIQFIITTHSPQVLGEITDDFNLLLLSRDESDLTKFHVESVTPGYYDSNLVLEDFMGTPSIDQNVVEMERNMFKAIHLGDFDTAETYLTQINHMTNGTNPAITKAKILSRRAKASM